jgi:hypothetical protein
MSDTVKVKLKTRLFVHGEARNKGTIVELPELADDGEPFAVLFGEIVPDDTPVSNRSAAERSADFTTRTRTRKHSRQDHRPDLVTRAPDRKARRDHVIYRITSLFL